MCTFPLLWEPCCRMKISKYAEELSSKEAPKRFGDIGTGNSLDYEKERRCTGSSELKWP
jgi:hypothetical protein